MSYLIDGNNLMGQRVGWHRDKARSRRELLSELASFSRTEGVRVAVAFDGAPEDHFPDGSSFMGVIVFYSERGSNADERIKRLVDEERERRTLFVVTSDRELSDYVRRSGARTVRAGEFRKRLDASKRKKLSQDENDPPPPSHEELLREMRYFGVAPEDDEE